MTDSMNNERLGSASVSLQYFKIFSDDFVPVLSLGSRGWDFSITHWIRIWGPS